LRILHVINGLDDGGAEGVLYRICTYNKEHEHIVFSMKGLGKYGKLLRYQGIEVRVLNISTFKTLPYAILKFREVLKETKPDLIPTWMYHANIFAGVLTKIFFYKKPVVWNIRCTIMKLVEAGLTTYILIYLGSLLSYFIPDCIVVCGKAVKSDHQEAGYKRSKMKIIENGFDLEYFKPPQKLQNINNNYYTRDLIVGVLGRFHPQKNHDLAIKACSIAISKNINLKLYLAGTGMTTDKSELNKSIRKHRMENFTEFFGALKDVRVFFKEIDVLLLPSKFGEGFPNVLAEAMAYGIPCIATSIGDSEKIIGQSGWVVPNQKPKEIVSAFEEIIEMRKNKSWLKIKNTARKRIEKNFSISKMITSYSKCWKDIFESANHT
jgi:glycosyltransferase involved in cell wall biosynthesis